MNLFLITGTTKGLGAALRDLLAADANNHVITLSRAPAKLDSPSNVYVDFADIASIEPAFAQVRQQLPGGHFARAVLLNNAGVANPVARFDRLESAGLANNLNVNLIAPMMTTKLFAQLTRERAAHRLVVNISSGAAKRAIAGWSAYCAAKAGLEMATRVAALEAATDDPTLAICSLAPGVVDTPMQAQIRAADFPDVERFRAMKADGVLRPAGDVARDMLKLIHDNRLANGGNYDIRELLNA
jgi:benzil reductase ((S)-benzoin forming)